MNLIHEFIRQPSGSFIKMYIFSFSHSLYFAALHWIRQYQGYQRCSGQTVLFSIWSNEHKSQAFVEICGNIENWIYSHGQQKAAAVAARIGSNGDSRQDNHYSSMENNLTGSYSCHSWCSLVWCSIFIFFFFVFASGDQSQLVVCNADRLRLIAFGER